MLEQNSIFKDTSMGPMIPKEIKYNLHYGEVWGDVLRSPHGTNTSCSVVKVYTTKIYRIYPLYSDRKALANSVNSDQTPHSLGMAGRKMDLLTFPLGVIGRLCSMIMLFLNILYTCSDIRTIMVRSSGVRILMINTALHVSRFATRKMDLRVPKSYNHRITYTSICNRKDGLESAF